LTISSTSRKSGPYTGNAVTTAFPFSFKVFATSDVVVVQTDLYAVETTLVLGVDYTVSLNSDQDSNPGGTVNMIVAPASGYLITLTSAVQNLQAVVLTNGGGFYPQVISDVFDRLTILVQQVAEKTSRALTVAISSGASTALPPPVANNLLGWDALGASIINYAGVASSAVSAAMAPIVSAATTAAARVGLGAAASGANTDITSLASPALGSATATTQAASDNSTKVATTAFVAGTQISNDARYAALLGNTANKFSVAAGVAATDAVNLGQFTTGQVKTTTAGNQPLPGGVILKSGYITGVGNGVVTTVTFPVAFPNGIEFATNIPTIFNNVGQTAPTASAAGAASFQFTNTTGITNNFFWFAIGY
jgi:hypothetical protein